MQKLCFQFAVLPLLIAHTSQLSVADSNATDLSVDTILRAWENRPAQVSSFVYDCSIDDEITTFKPRAKSDPFEAPPKGKPKGSIVVQKLLTMKKQDRNTAYHLSGEHCDTDNFEVIEQDLQATKLRNEIRQLVTSSRGTFGMGSFGKPGTRMDSHVYVANCLPILFWSDPLYVVTSYRIPKSAWSLLHQPNVSRSSDLDVTMFSEQRFGRNKTHLVSTVVTVMKHPPHLPTQVTRLRNGKPRFIYQLQYSQHRECQWKLDSWGYQQLNNDGVVMKLREGEVLSFDYGIQLAESEFSLEFPIGAHIVEYRANGNRYWLQSAKDSMDEMSAEDYGKRPK